MPTIKNSTDQTIPQYNVLCGSAVNSITPVSGLGTAAQVLTSNGAGLYPTWQDAVPSYQTGSFTATLSFGGASVGIVYSYNQGQYTKIGNTVFFDFGFGLLSKGVSTGQCLFNGLPFPVHTIIQDTVCNLHASNIPAGTYSIYCTAFGVVTDQLNPICHISGSPETVTNLDDTFFNNNTEIRCWGFYFT